MEGHGVVGARWKRAIGLALSAVAIGSIGIVAEGASALPPGSPPSAGLLPLPASGTDVTAFPLALTAPDDVCPGDSATGGHRVQTFVASAGVDAATLTYDAAGPILPAGAPGGTVVQPLSTPAGAPLTDLETIVGTGQVAAIAEANLDLVTGISPGEYHLGLACSVAGETVRFWQTTITVTGVAATTFDWSLGTVPAPPTLIAPLTADDGALAGSFTAAVSDPAATGHLVTAVPRGGGAPITVTVAAAGAFSVGGLTNGTTYDVSVVSTNGVGTSAVSNTVSGVPAIPPRPPVSGLTVVPGTESAVVRWTAPTGATPLEYRIDVVPGVSGAPFTAAATSASFLVGGLTGGTTYTFTVTPQHPAPFVAVAATSPPTAVFSPLIGVGSIDVLRPVGGLVLTQRCGVYGELPEEVAALGFPLVPASPASVDTVGVAPVGPDGLADPAFQEYPYPAAPTYPTRCALDMGTSTLLTRGLYAGQYFAATGRLNQVSVVDTRDVDAGFSVAGRVSDFASGTESFSAAHLGWTPIVSNDSVPALDGYDQLVIAGATVAPGVAGGLSSAQPLATAPAGRGLGIATIDARMKLLIPVTADAGTYTAALTITAI